MKCGFHLISITVYLKKKTVEIKSSHEESGRNPRTLRSSIKQFGRISRFYTHNRWPPAQINKGQRLSRIVSVHGTCLVVFIVCYLLSLQESRGSNWPHVTYFAARQTVGQYGTIHTERDVYIPMTITLRGNTLA
jgi:hypothetical protein